MRNLLDLLWGFFDDRMIREVGRDGGEAKGMPKSVGLCLRY